MASVPFTSLLVVLVGLGAAGAVVALGAVLGAWGAPEWERPGRRERPARESPGVSGPRWEPEELALAPLVAVARTAAPRPPEWEHAGSIPRP